MQKIQDQKMPKNYATFDKISQGKTRERWEDAIMKNKNQLLGIRS